MITREEYRDYCERYRNVWGYLRSVSYSDDIVIDSVCIERGYDRSRMGKVLRDAGVIFVDMERFDLSVLKKIDVDGDLGVLTQKGEFLLPGRYILPVRDMLGNVIAMVGWQKDSDRKYITTASRLFSKDCLFFGMEQVGLSGLGQPCVLVEGIFDSLSVRSLGLNCVAMMGINSSRFKVELYGLFGKVLAIPDGDGEGRKVIREDAWSLPSNGRYFRWVGESVKGIKDIDEFVKIYSADDVRELLLEAFEEPERVVSVRLN